MSNVLGTIERPLRVAIIGSGPSGFYAADSLLKAEQSVEIDMYERLPTPFGLVRYGVAPDHPKIKSVTKVYEKIAAHENFRFYGNVHIGKEIALNELKQFYDAILIATGAETDRKLGIPGEDLLGSHTATEFVAWYNGHPDFQDRVFDLSQEIAVVVGQGNVAMDVSRILCKTVDELKDTDISSAALEQLAESKIKEVHMVGRRGPAQAAFTTPELKEMGNLSICQPLIDPTDLELNEASLKELEDPANKVKTKNVELLKEFVGTTYENKTKKFFLHFFRSPLEIQGSGRVQKIIFEENQLMGDPGQQRSRGTGKKFEIDCGILFRSIGYRGIPIKGLPFSEQHGVIPNEKGRVADSEVIYTGLYTAGWIKRGPSGVIGTNKPDSDETVQSLLEDIPHMVACHYPNREALEKFLEEAEVHSVSFNQWKKIDEAEIARGEKSGKPREKFLKVSGMLNAIQE